MKSINRIIIGILATLLFCVMAALCLLLVVGMRETERLKDDVARMQEQLNQQRTADTRQDVQRTETCRGGSVRYYSIYTPLSFCYPSQLGGVEERETTIDPDAREGTRYHLSFSNAEDIRITIQTANFRKLNNSNVPPIVSFSCLDFNKTDEDLKACFYDPVTNIERMAIRGTRALLADITYPLLDSQGETGKETVMIVPDISKQPKLDVLVSAPKQEVELVTRILESVEP